ncbi:hypothetical protein [Roseovarius sp. 2305UL8-3]|uniref:hypothetical protein n=1 Tax=Roseovarius conchicola TaxID=3121636 RepID=UPI00352821DF
MMYRLSVLAAVLLVFVTASFVGAESKRPIYFPLGTWAVEEHWSPMEKTLFYEEWFGNQLLAMGEPSLARTKLDEGAVAVRLLVLPTFTPAFAIHFEKRVDGLTRLEATLLDGAGGYAPGRVDQRYSRELPRSDLDEVLKHLEQLSLMNGGQIERRDAACSDGTQFVLEIARQAYFHAVDVHHCQALPPVWALIDEILALVPELGPYCDGCFQRDFD